MFIVDDDPNVRQSISSLARSVGLKAETYATAQEFLDAETDERPGCLILDVRMPGMSGLELQQELAQRSWQVPIILLTAYAEVPMATQAMRVGAIDFIQKPFSPHALLERIHEAVQIDADARRENAKRAKVAELVASLSPREHEVMDLLAAGHSTKKIAAKLHISAKTVDNHRAEILEKMHVGNVVQLTRQVALTEKPHRQFAK